VLFTFLGILVTVGCAYASARRLWLAAEATWLDPFEFAAVVRAAAQVGDGEGTEDRGAASGVWDALRAEIQGEPRADWERDLFEALVAPAPVRVALVNEQLAELDYRAQRWARVPRVCASIASSTGFFFAALAMRAGLASDAMDIEGAILAAINVVAVGMAGTTFCIAAHVRAGAMTRARLAATDKLVESLEAWAATRKDDPGRRGVSRG
jgi:hypothetical protein